MEVCFLSEAEGAGQRPWPVYHQLTGQVYHGRCVQGQTCFVTSILPANISLTGL